MSTINRTHSSNGSSNGSREYKTYEEVPGVQASARRSLFNLAELAQAAGYRAELLFDANSKIGVTLRVGGLDDSTESGWKVGYIDLVIAEAN
jgi:hypothetical protein